MKIEILGPGCQKCQTLTLNAKSAAEELGLDCEIVKVTDANEIVRRGVFLTPALLVDGKVKSVGRVGTVSTVKELLMG